MTYPATYTWQKQHRRTALWIVGFLLLFQLIIGLFIEIGLPGVRDPEFQERLEKLQTRIARNPQKPLLMMLGSSRTSYSFAARDFERRTDDAVVAFNFGIPGAGPVMQSILLKRLDDAGIRPDHLILEVLPIHYNGVIQPPSEARMLDAARLTLHELGESHKYFSQCESSWKKWLWGRLLPTNRHQAELREATHLDTSTYYDSRPNVPRVDQWGWQPNDVPKDKAEAIRQLAHAQYDEYYAKFEVLPGAREALNSILQYANRRNIRITLILMPEGTEFRSLTTEVAEAALQKFLKDIQSETSVEILDARAWLEDAAFYDMHHVNPGGGVSFTKRLFAEYHSRLANLTQVSKSP
jgi:hypothetical protein